MFVGVARLELRIPEAGSLKSKRQVLRQLVDRLKAKFNVSLAEVGDQDLWQKAVVGLSVVSGDRRHADEQLERIIRFVEETYVAPLVSRQTEVMSLGDQLYSGPQTAAAFPVDRGERSLAEAEGMEPWEARKKARALRRPRDWERE